MDDLNDFVSWAQATRCYELPTRCYELLKGMEDMNESKSWAQGSRRYDKLKVVINMNDFG